MRSAWFMMALVITTLAGCGGGSSTGGFTAEATYVVDLTTAAVVPAPNSSEATGGAAFIVYSDRIEYQVGAQFTGGVTAVHIHQGAPGAQGPEVVTLFSSTAPISTIGAFATGTMLDANLPQGVTLAALKSLFASGNGYVDIHTAANPDGELRGQIR